MLHQNTVSEYLTKYPKIFLPSLQHFISKCNSKRTTDIESGS